MRRSSQKERNNTEGQAQNDTYSIESELEQTVSQRRASKTNKEVKWVEQTPEWKIYANWREEGGRARGREKTVNRISRGEGEVGEEALFFLRI